MIALRPFLLPLLLPLLLLLLPAALVLSALPMDLRDQLRRYGETQAQE